MGKKTRKLTELKSIAYKTIRSGINCRSGEGIRHSKILGARTRLWVVPAVEACMNLTEKLARSIVSDSNLPVSRVKMDSGRSQGRCNRLKISD